MHIGGKVIVYFSILHTNKYNYIGVKMEFVGFYLAYN